VLYGFHKERKKILQLLGIGEGRIVSLRKRKIRGGGESREPLAENCQKNRRVGIREKEEGSLEGDSKVGSLGKNGQRRESAFSGTGHSRGLGA